jgi:GNAT superfamily N-acetyltransferase
LSGYNRRFGLHAPALLNRDTKGRYMRRIAAAIRMATKEDLPAILALQKRAYRTEATRYQDYSIPPLTQTLAELEEECTRSTVLCATVGERIIGSVRARVTGSVNEIGRLMVHPEYRRRGLGRALLRAIERDVSQDPRGPRRFELFTGELSYDNIALYQSEGYCICRFEHYDTEKRICHLAKNVPPCTPREPFEIVRPEPADAERINALIADVFLRCVAPDYAPEGIGFFLGICTPEEVIAVLRGGAPIYAATCGGGDIAGVIWARDGNHIARFFVSPDCQRRGIGRRLFQRLAADVRRTGMNEITVHASPFAVEAYARLGFVCTGREKTGNGMRYVPMKYSLPSGPAA